MSNPSTLAIAAALAAVAASPLASANAFWPPVGPSLSESNMQSHSGTGPVWHPNSPTTVTLAASGERVRHRQAPPPRDYLMLPDDATNVMTPSQASHVTGHVDSSAGPPRTGADVQAGNMGPNSSKGQ